MNFAWLKKRKSRPQDPSWPAPPFDEARRCDPRPALGRRGERLAARRLKRALLRILVRNYRCPAGEIDLICADRETLVFVEVKTRTNDAVQDLTEAVRVDQWKRIENAARCFRSHPAAADRPFRFDLVTVHWPEKGRPVVEHFRDAHLPS